MHKLEINVLFGFIKMADEMGFMPQWWFDWKKAQQKNQVWIKSKFKENKEKMNPEEKKKSFMLKKNQSSF